MPNLHELNCATDRKNVAFGSCFVDWKLIKGAFLFDYAKVFTAAELTALSTTLRNLAQNDSKSLRMYPIHNFVNPTDNTEEETIQTFADGSKYPVRDGTFDWTFQFTAGGYELLKALRSHNGFGYAIFYDADGKILGYNNQGSFAAIPLNFFYAKSWKMNSGSATAAYSVRFVFNTNYALEDSDYVKSDFLLSTIVGLKDIRLQVNSFNPTTGLVNVTMREEIGGNNLFDLYSAQLGQPSALKATNEQTGGDITVTTVTPNSSSKTFAIQLNHADTDWPVSGYVDLTTKAPSVLSGLGVSGYEGELTKLSVATS